MKNRNSIVTYGSVLMAMIFWSFSFIWYKQVFAYYLPVTLIFLRLSLAIPLLFIFSFATGKLQRIKARHIGWFILLGFFEPFLYFIGESYGVSLVSSTLAAIIISLIPLLTPIPAHFLFGEKFSAVNLFGLIISVTGVMLVILGEDETKAASVAGIFLMILAVISAVVYSILVKKLVVRYSSFTIVTWQSVFGLAFFIPVFLFTEFTDFLTTGIVLKAFIPIIKMAVFASALAFLLYIYSIKNIGMARTNVFANLIPVFTAILARIVLNEQFTAMKTAGVAVVVAGLVITQYHKGK
jgi:drug/metabolite transporter (DMT)-like permease